MSDIERGIYRFNTAKIFFHKNIHLNLDSFP